MRLLQLEVATAMVTDADRLRSTQPIDLVQLSLRAENWFTEQTRNGAGKLAGLALHRFGGFLKRSWRVNDWIWGRLDAATVLTRIVLSPDRLLRLQAVTGRAARPTRSSTGSPPASTAAWTCPRRSQTCRQPPVTSWRSCSATPTTRSRRCRSWPTTSPPACTSTSSWRSCRSWPPRSAPTASRAPTRGRGARSSSP